MGVLEFAKYIDVVNASFYFQYMSTIYDRRDFVDTIEYILINNSSLWFTPYGNLYLSAYGPDCKLDKPDRINDHNYTVMIYNGYE